jgi:hypothetical protein
MQSLFPIFFVFLFFSSMAMPRDLIEQDWFRTVADLQLHQPTLDDVFLDKTGRKLEGAGDGPEAENLEPQKRAVPA